MIDKIRSTYKEYPSAFWVLVISGFIDRIGGTMIFPFFALYITGRFNVGMTQAGIILGLFSLFSSVGNMIGGGLADRIGRRTVMLMGLILSALSTLALGLVNNYYVLYGLAIIAGFLSNFGHPAREAMIADIIEEDKRADAFGIMRVAMNVAWMVGPTIGGFIAYRSYLSAFVADTVASLIAALILFLSIPESRPETVEGQPGENFLQTFANYRLVLRDRAFLAFVLVTSLMMLVYTQLYSTLSVYLRDVHGVPEQGYGFLMSLNASVVVVLQFFITRKVSKHPPMLMMALGTVLYIVGYTMYGFVGGFVLFAVAMLIITFGEMIVMPLGYTIVSKLAPVDMRGRYMAAYSLTWAIPNAIGPAAAGLIMDNYNPDWVWYIGGIILTVAMVGYLLMHASTQTSLKESPKAV